MSFLFKPGAGGGGGIAGTAVDPVSPGGVLIDPLTELTQPGGPLPAGTAIIADGLGGYIFGSPAGADVRFAVQFHHDAGVPSFGTRYLRYGEGVHTSQAGFRMTADGQLRGITVQVNTTSTNDYDIEILRDPAGRAGGPFVLGTLALPAGSLFAVDRSLAVAVTTAMEIGARVVRSSGSGVSSFTALVVKTEWSIP